MIILPDDNNLYKLIDNGFIYIHYKLINNKAKEYI